VTGRVFTKLFFSCVVVLFLGMVVLDFSLRQVMEQSLREQAEESLVGEARLLAAHINASGSTSLDVQSLQRIARLDAAATGAEVTIFNAQGQLVTSSEPNPLPEPGAPAPELAAVVDQHQSLGRARRGSTLYVAAPAGPLVVRLAYRFNGVPAAVHKMRRGIVLASLLSLVVATLLAAWLAQRAAKRLARIVVFANRIAAGDLSARVEEGNLDEISAVAHALDVTASRLEHSFHALESSRSELTALLDSMQEAVIAINPQGQACHLRFPGQDL
jgi:two-component system phosphate regulon sensor histidine kinase PhoR